MGDRPMEPPSLVVDITRLCPALVVDTDPVDRVRSAEHAHVVPDVLWTPRRSVCGAYGWRETPCQRHVSPHNPSRFETTVDIPRQRPFRRTLRSARPAQTDVPTVVPRRRRWAVRLAAGCGGCRHSRGHDVDPSFCGAICRRRPSGRAAITLTSPPAAPSSLTLSTSSWVHC